MGTLFLICAVIGGTILLCQCVMTCMGLGHHDFDAGHEIGPADAHGGDFDGHDIDGHDAHGQHGSTWLFSVVSFRTLVAAATFFGLAGLASQSAQLSSAAQVVIALACGIAAMYGTHWTIRQFNRLGEDGTVRIHRAVGQKGTVYLTIPPARSASGKVQIKIQGRLMEYEAVTDSDTGLATGARVVVVAIEEGNRLKVDPVEEHVPAEAPS
jgi:membrane protein implicated in regulation of membrane protease activity